MLKSIKLKDFQSHVDTCLPLGPGLNIISGPSGNGKSSILRAVSALAYNNIPGTAPIRLPNGKEYTITIETEDATIVRTKGKKVNSYNVAGTVFNDVGVNVPEKVTALLNIAPIELDANTEININFANQMDAPFLLTIPDAAKVKFLNTLAGTNAVDLAAKEAVNLARDNANRVREVDALLEIKNNTAGVLSKNIEHLHGLNKYLKEQMETLEALKEELAKMQALKARFLKFKSAWLSLVRAKEDLAKMDVSGALEKVRRYMYISDLNRRKIALETAFHSLYARKKIVSGLNVAKAQEIANKALTLYKLKNKYNDLHEKYKLLCKNRKKVCILDVGASVATIKKFLTVTTLHQRYTTLRSNYLDLNSKKTASITVRNDLKQRYVAALKGMQICPVCNSPITSTTLNTILEKL